MKKRIERRLELTPDEIKSAIISSLRDTTDQPAPSVKDEDVKFKLTAKGATVSWIEEGEAA